jgi:hypothetical protein
MVKSALEEIVNAIGRDRGIRDNDYIQDENADRLKEALRSLERSGVRCYDIIDKVEQLAWFVGGDPDKIRQLQSCLNQLGVGGRLDEDGVFSEKTKEAVDRVIDNIGDFLADPDQMQKLDKTIAAMVSALDSLPSQQGKLSMIHYALKQYRREVQRIVWKLGAQFYLRPRGYEVAAMMLEHSLETSPSDFFFSGSHWVTEKVVRSNGFQRAYAELVKNIRKDPDRYATLGKIDMDFQATGDKDLYYGIGKCAIIYTYTWSAPIARLKFTLDDEYNFDELRSISGSVETFIQFNFTVGPLANDAGLLSEADTVLSRYKTHIEFTKTIVLKDVKG